MTDVLYGDSWSTVYHADALSVADVLPEKSVHTCITSPPYFGLRSYLAAEDVRKSHEIGAEESPEEYVAALVEVFRGVWRVLRDDGTVWLNLGSNYVSGKIESQEYVLRDDLTDQERAYVYAELAEHFRTESEAVSGVRQGDASPEQDVSGLLPPTAYTPSELRREGV